MKIYPSILEPSAQDVFERLTSLFPVFDHFHIDIADGQFVENQTVQIEDISTYINENKPEIPAIKTFEFHLMVEDYTSQLKKLDELSSQLNITQAIVHLKPLQDNDYLIPNTKYPVGIAINPNAGITENWRAIRTVRTVQIMTVEPGKQGQPFLPECLDKVKELRQLDFNGTIIVDGAMNEKNLQTVMEQKHLPDAICPGSYFRKGDPKSKLVKLESLILKS